ncbi:HAD domain-containing protein [Paraburkholderia mimosarum]|uniref:HAD domain-containing protein n=1 Tax=Paraburkholderia mimosarum TaxID=312026 RepID=UPI000483DEE8|nr:HAD domain-containing protein [Paraburkholderia mimosarum]
MVPPLLYLGLQGVALARRSLTRIPLHQLENPCVEQLPLLEQFTLVAELHDFRVVLNDWLVADLGYRTVLSLLPAPIARKTIGATMRGNRAHRRHVGLMRKDLLRADIERRNPHRFLIVDAYASAIPFEHKRHAVLVDESAQESASHTVEAILQLLFSDVNHMD